MPEKAVALILERLRRRFLRPEAEPIQLLDVPTSRGELRTLTHRPPPPVTLRTSSASLYRNGWQL